MKISPLEQQVKTIIHTVQRSGDSALKAYTKRFDGITISSFKVPKAEILQAVRSLEKGLRAALDQAARNIQNFHQQELSHLPCSWTFTQKGSVTGQMYAPIATVGIYVPGGRFSYPSTVLMTAIPARVAGVEKVIMATPPKQLTPAVLYAAYISGVDEIYRVGGPAAIAALAFGTESIPKTDFIVGPGNAYVNEAKRQLLGVVGIDALAGPSEVAIIADAKAPANYIIADLLAQAEHDPRAMTYLFSDSKTLLSAIGRMLPRELRTQVTLKACKIEQAINAVNKIAPEHLELMVENPATIIGKIKNAGAVFIGYATPTAVGDYWAGPNHVLPTGGSARCFSPLALSDIVKTLSIASSFL